MKLTKFRRYLLLFLVMICLFQVGCFGKKELNDIGIVNMIGIDMTPDKKIKLTVSSIIPVQGSSKNESNKSDTFLYTSIGDSIVEAIEDFKSIHPKYALWSHTDLIVFGSGLLNADVSIIAGTLARLRYFRYSSKILVSKDKTAQDLLQIPSQIDSSLFTELISTINNDKDSSRYYVADLKDMCIALAQKGATFVTGVVLDQPSNIRNFSTNVQQIKTFNPSNKESKIARIEGCAVLKNEKFVGFLDVSETQGFVYLTKKEKRDTIDLEVEQGKGIVSFSASNFKSKIDTKVFNNNPSITIKTIVNANIVQCSKAYDLRDKHIRDSMEYAISIKIKDLMNQSISKCQKVLNADIFGFGRKIQISHPKVWKSIESRWDEVFPNIPVSVDVDVTILRYGELFNGL